MDLIQWAESITKKVYSEWKDKYAFWESGFKIFYGPLKKSPEVMIISYNPGGSKYYYELEDLNRYKIDDFSPPKTNTYLQRDNKMARKMRDLFSEHSKELEESVTFPVLFFRTKNKQHWMQSFPREDRLYLEKYCIDIVQEIIHITKPRKILVLGFETFTILQSHIFGNLDSKDIKFAEYGARNERLYQIANWQNVPIFVMRHPTGSRIRKQDWSLIKKKFWEINPN